MERTPADFYDEDDVLRFLRHKRRRISESDRRWLDRAREIVDAAAVYRETHQRRPWRSTDTGGCWGDTVLPYRSLGRLFADCDEVIVCGCTIGQDVYRTIREWMATDPALGVVVDATASVLVDAYAAYLQHTFGATTMRFSPGYGDVPLALNQDAPVHRIDYDRRHRESRRSAARSTAVSLPPTKRPPAVVSPPPRRSS